MSDFLNEWWDDAEDFFSPSPPSVNELLFGFNDQVDSHAQDLFFDAFVNNDESKWDQFEQYLMDTYGIDYDHDDHWADYREWYATS